MEKLTSKELFLEGHEFDPLPAMVLYNMDEYREAVAWLLRTPVETTGDPAGLQFQRALEYYAGHLAEEAE